MEGLLSVIRAAVLNNIRGFDTAPSCQTEEILGSCLKKCMKEYSIDRSELYIQTKIDAWKKEK